MYVSHVIDNSICGYSCGVWAGAYAYLEEWERHYAGREELAHECPRIHTYRCIPARAYLGEAPGLVRGASGFVGERGERGGGLPLC